MPNKTKITVKEDTSSSDDDDQENIVCVYCTAKENLAAAVMQFLEWILLFFFKLHFRSKVPVNPLQYNRAFDLLLCFLIPTKQETLF